MQALKLNYNTQQHELRDYQAFTQRRQKKHFLAQAKNGT